MTAGARRKKGWPRILLPPAGANAITMELNEHDDVVRRLHAFGRRPVDPDVAGRHAALLRTAAGAPAPRSRLRPVMVGTFLAGSLLGGAGLAGATAAGKMPEPAQNALHHALARVNVDVPKADEDPDARGDRDEGDKRSAKGDRRSRTAEGRTSGDGPPHGVARSTEGCPPGFTGNHGQYVRSVRDDPATPENEKALAARSQCGKPVPSLHDDDGDGERRKGTTTTTTATSDDTTTTTGAGKDPAEAEGAGDDDRRRPRGRAVGRPDGEGPSDAPGRPHSVGRAEDGDDDEARSSRGAGQRPQHGRGQSGGRGGD